MAFKEWSFDPQKATGVKVPKENLEQALEDVATFIKEKVLLNTGKGAPSVNGGRFVRDLTPEYRKHKRAEGGSGVADLELTGDLLDAFETSVSGRRVYLDITDEDQHGKAEGHLTGKYGEHSRTRPRQFMPQGTQKLSSDIMEGVKEILQQYEDEDA